MSSIDPAKQPLSEHPFRRRRAVTIGVAGVAVMAGAGVAWWKMSPDASSGDERNATSIDLWRSEFETPQGGRLSMANFQGKPLLLNFWATWCPPCVDELPLLDRFYQENTPKSWQVLGIAVDKLDAVQRFLLKMPLQFPVVMAGMDGTALSRSLGNLGGGLPYTVVFDRKAKVVHRKMGALKTDELHQLAQSYSV